MRDGAGHEGGMGGERHHGRMGRHGGGMGMMMMHMADANKDNAVSQAEFTAAALQRFDRADANKDGQVTKEERQAARTAMHSQMRQRMGAGNMGGGNMSGSNMAPATAPSPASGK
jgi:hypothetical protein